MDEDTRKRVTRQLKIISGQVGGIQKMVDNGEYCLDILTQISAIHESLRTVGKRIVRQHLETCVTHGIRGDKPAKHYDEMMDIIYKYSK